MRTGFNFFYGWVQEDFEWTIRSNTPGGNKTDDFSLDGPHWGIGASVGGTVSFDSFTLEPFFIVGWQGYDLDGDGDFDILTCEMEAVGGDRNPRWYIWENLDGKGGQWQEHVILDVNLGGHEIVVGDITGNGLPDIVGKPWRPRKENALEG